MKTAWLTGIVAVLNLLPLELSAQAPQLAIDMDPNAPGFQNVRVLGSPGEISCDVYALGIENVDSYAMRISFVLVEGSMSYCEYLGAENSGDGFPALGCNSLYYERVAINRLSTEIVESISGADQECAPDGSVHLFSLVFNISQTPIDTIVNLIIGGTLVTVSGASYLPTEISASLQGVLLPVENDTWGSIKGLFE